MFIPKYKYLYKGLRWETLPDLYHCEVIVTRVGQRFMIKGSFPLY